MDESMQYFFILHTLILHTLELFFTCVAMYGTILHPAISQKNQNMNSRHCYKFYRYTSCFTNFSMHSTS